MNPTEPSNLAKDFSDMNEALELISEEANSKHADKEQKAEPNMYDRPLRSIFDIKRPQNQNPGIQWEEGVLSRRDYKTEDEFNARLGEWNAKRLKLIETVENYKTKQTRGYFGEYELCRVCGWTSRMHGMGIYLPHVRIDDVYAKGGLWALGNDWVLWDRLKTHRQSNEFVTWQFLKSQGNPKIPIVSEMHELSSPDDPIQLTLMSRAQGVPLRSVWERLSQEEKDSYLDQLTEAIRELRKFTSPVACRVDGKPLRDYLVQPEGCSFGRCKNIGKTYEEWVENMGEELRNGLCQKHRTQDTAFIDKKIQGIKDNFPDAEAPFVLSHGDLHAENIMVKDGKITAIIDWERAGYYPWWVEPKVSLENGEFAFQPVWANIFPKDLDWDKVYEDSCLNELFQSITLCKVEHKQDEHLGRWLIPPICECKPTYGAIQTRREVGDRHEFSDEQEVNFKNGKAYPLEEDGPCKCDIEGCDWIDEECKCKGTYCACSPEYCSCKRGLDCRCPQEMKDVDDGLSYLFELGVFGEEYKYEYQEAQTNGQEKEFFEKNFPGYDPSLVEKAKTRVGRFFMHHN